MLIFFLPLCSDWSAMGHKQTLEQASELSALPHESGHAPSHPEMSAKCH